MFKLEGPVMVVILLKYMNMLIITVSQIVHVSNTLVLTCFINQLIMIFAKTVYPHPLKLGTMVLINVVQFLFRDTTSQSTIRL